MDKSLLAHIKSLRHELRMVQWRCANGTDSIYYDLFRASVSDLTKVIDKIEKDIKEDTAWAMKLGSK